MGSENATTRKSKFMYSGVYPSPHDAGERFVCQSHRQASPSSRGEICPTCRHLSIIFKGHQLIVHPLVVYKCPIDNLNSSNSGGELMAADREHPFGKREVRTHGMYSFTGSKESMSIWVQSRAILGSLGLLLSSFELSCECETFLAR